MSIGEELKLKMDNNIPRAFQWVIASSASSTLTIGERNMSRCDEWITFVCVPPLFILVTAGAANITYSKPFWSGFPWWLPVTMLAGVYLAVVYLAMGHITLFLPEAPFAAREALLNVGFRGIGLAVILISNFSLLFVNHTWLLVTLACLESALIAAVLAFWVCLVRAYGKQRATGTKS